MRSRSVGVGTWIKGEESRLAREFCIARGPVGGESVFARNWEKISKFVGGRK
jgi:hypothetical protein